MDENGVVGEHEEEQYGGRADGGDEGVSEEMVVGGGRGCWGRRTDVCVALMDAIGVVHGIDGDDPTAENHLRKVRSTSAERGSRFAG